MADQQGFGDDVKLYALLIDQLQRYNSIVWQVPTALVAADVVAFQQLQSWPFAMLGVSLVSAVLSFAYYRMVVQQEAIISATRKAELSLRIGHDAFIPEFQRSAVSARWLIVVALAVFNLGFTLFALRRLRTPPPVTRPSLSFLVTVAGYSLAVVGSLLLFLGTPQDIGIGKVPVIAGEHATEFFADQERAVAKRQRQTRIGFALLLVGMILQLTGFVAAFL